MGYTKTTLSQDQTTYSIYEPKSAKPNGKTAMLIHGTFHNENSFTPLAEMLAEQGYKVVTPTLAYHGLGEKAPLFAPASEYLQPLRALFEAEKPDILVSHSLGAWFAYVLLQEAKEHNPEFELESLVLLSPAPPTRGQIMKLETESFMHNLWMLGDMMKTRDLSGFLEFIKRQPEFDNFPKEQLDEIMSKQTNPYAFSMKVMNALVMRKLKPEVIKSAAAKRTVILGPIDGVVKPKYVEFTAQALDAQLGILPEDFGHEALILPGKRDLVFETIINSI